MLNKITNMANSKTDPDIAFETLSNIDCIDPGEIVQRKEEILRGCYEIVKMRYS